MDRETKMQSKGIASTAIMLCAAHSLAFAILFFVPVFICPTVVDFYARFGIPKTPLFTRAHIISDYMSAYTGLYLFCLFAYLVILYRRSRARSTWLPAFSHFVLLSIALFGMVYTAWLINPMPFGVAKEEGQPVASESIINTIETFKIAHSDR